jgi:hypothetical protein
MDNRRRYCDGCRSVRKKLFDLDAKHRVRERSKMNRLKEQEELAGLRTENDILREEVARLENLVQILKRR